MQRRPDEPATDHRAVTAAAEASVCLSELSTAPGSVSKDGFQFEELVESGLTPFAGVFRLVVAAEGATEIRLCPVDVHVARADTLRNPAGPCTATLFQHQTLPHRRRCPTDFSVG